MRIFLYFYDLCEDCQLTIQHPEGGFVLAELACSGCQFRAMNALFEADRAKEVAR